MIDYRLIQDFEYIYIYIFAVCVVRNKSDFVLYVFANWLVGPYLTVMTLTAQPAEASCSKDAAKYYLPSTVIGEQAFGVKKKTLSGEETTPPFFH